MVRMRDEIAEIRANRHDCVFLASYLHVELSEVVVQNPTGETAEAQVGAEASGTGIQRASVDPRVLEAGHPHLYRIILTEISSTLRLTTRAERTLPLCPCYAASSLIPC